MRITSITVLCAAPFVGTLTTSQEDPLHPSTSFPRTWDEAALATLELPNALTGEPSKPVGAEFYYAIPARTIYQTHPLYLPDQGPDGYLERLLKLEPKIIMGPEDSFEPYADWTEQDWVVAGEEVFRTPLASFPFDPTILPVMAARGAAIGMPEIADGRPPFTDVVLEKKGELRVGNLSCAECHTRVLPNGSTIVGAQGSMPFDRIFAMSLERLSAAEAPARMTELFGAPTKEGVTPTIPKGVDGPALAAAHRAIPPGVAARHGTASMLPVQVPDLIGVRDRRYLDRTGLHRHRGVGDMMRYVALNQGMDRLSSWAGYTPEAESVRAAHAAGLVDDETLRMGLAAVESPVGRTRYSDPQLYALAMYVYSLEPPENPHPMGALALEGAEIFEAECSKCHPAPLYTSNQLVPAPGFRPSETLLSTEAIRRRGVGTDPGLTMTTRRGTGFYKIPSLLGVWYRGPFSHDGSVATLEDWFDPRRLREDYVPTGWNPGGGPRAVKGHEFGLDLSESERAALIAFLRTL